MDKRWLLMGTRYPEKTIGDVLADVGDMKRFPCFKQYYRQGMCTETEKPSGRIHSCPVEHGSKCLIEEDK